MVGALGVYVNLWGLFAYWNGARLRL